jgi:hypothetical protein
MAVVVELHAKSFLQPHHLVAAGRIERLVERACLAPRVTMSYAPNRIGGASGNVAADISDGAAAARRKLNDLALAIPADCWNVVFDVCAMGKGLQLVETERQWPRRSAKLVLRIGLDQLAALMRLSPHASGRQQLDTRGWLEERLPLIAPDPG